MGQREPDVERGAGFEQLRSYCEDRFPDPIYNNIDILYFSKWDGDDRHDGPSRWTQRLVGAFFLEYYSLTSSLHRDDDQRNLNTVDILVPFTNTCRYEYQPFIHTVLDRLDDEYDVGIFTSRRMCSGELDRTLYDDVTFVCEEDLISYDLYRSARRNYLELKPAIDELCSGVGLQDIERWGTHRFFKKYFLDRHVFKYLLSEVEPRILYSVQYNSNRGYLRAIEEYSDRRSVSNVVVQHGAFRDIHFHPFAGADHAILWGEHFKEALSGIDTPPQPCSVHVLGNPNLETKMEELEPSFRCTGSGATILYASTGSPNSLEALTMFAEVVSGTDEVDVIYKPHPHGEAEKYDRLIDRGLVTSNQLRPGTEIYSLVAGVDVVFGTQTSVLPEAIVFDTPAIQLSPDPSTEAWREHGLRYISSKSDLTEEIDRIATEDGYTDELLDQESELGRRMFGEIDGSAARIAELVESLSRR